MPTTTKRPRLGTTKRESKQAAADEKFQEKVRRAEERLAKRNRKFLDDLGIEGLLRRLHRKPRAKVRPGEFGGFYDGDPWRVLRIMASDDAYLLCRTTHPDLLFAISERKGFILANYISEEALLGYLYCLLTCLWKDTTREQRWEAAMRLREVCKPKKRYTFERYQWLGAIVD